MSFLTAQSIDFEPKKSLCNAHKRYRIIRLKNGLLVLLVCDASTELASCAVVSATGSHNDPTDIRGLAHYCEHALFLGTKEFPGTNEFMELIESNGGNSNAFTTGEQTSFYFEVPVSEAEFKGELIFDYALRNFSSFFRSPSFNESSIKNEVQAINSEHEANISSSEKIFYHCLRILANPSHPFSNFGTGNTHSLGIEPRLRSKDVTSELRNYFHSNYTSEKFTAVLKGPQSLNSLQKLAITNFSDISSVGKVKSSSKLKRISSSRKSYSSGSISSADTLSTPISSSNILNNSFAEKYGSKTIFTPTNLSNVIFIESSQFSKFQVVFPIYINCDWSSTLENVWCNLIGEESTGSLVDYLKNSKNYITEMFVHVQKLSVNDKVLTIDTTMTGQGFKNFSSILSILLSYVHEVTVLPVPFLTKYIAEQYSLAKLNYYYQDPYSSPMDEVSDLASLLQADLSVLGLENILQGFPDINDSNMTEEFWIKKANQCLKASKKVFSMNNFNLSVACADLSVLKGFVQRGFLNEELNFGNFSKDQYYGFNYQILKLNPLILYQCIIEHGIKYPINFPQGNKFITHNLEELEKLISENLSSEYSTKNLSSINDPILIEYTEHREFWFKKEYQQSLSKATISYQYSLLEVPPSPEYHVSMEVLCEIFGSKLRGEMYSGELAGYSWGLFPTLNGKISMSLTVSGISAGVKKIVTFISEQLKQLLESGIKRISYTDFKRARINVRTEYDNLIKGNGIRQALAGSQLFLEENIWTLEERIDAIELLDEDILQEFAYTFLQGQKYTDILVTGDIEKDQMFSLTNSINLVTGQENSSMSGASFTPASSYELNSGENSVFSIPNSNLEDPLSTISYYIQIGLRSDPYVRTMAEFLAHYLSANASFELRTKRQLGYTVLSGPLLTKRVSGFCIYVMSGTHDTEMLRKEIESYLLEMEINLYHCSDEEFSTKILHPFLNSLGDEKRDQGFPANILYSTPPAQSSSNFNSTSDVYLVHRNMWEKIVTKTYRFNGKNGHDEVNEAFLRRLSKEQFLSFFQRVICVKSATRSSLTIAIDSSMDKEKMKREVMKVEMGAYLASQGVHFEVRELEELLESCGYESKRLHVALMRVLDVKHRGLKHFALTLKSAGSYFSRRSKSIAGTSIEGIEREYAKLVKKRTVQSPVPTYVSGFMEVHANSSLVRDFDRAKQYEIFEHYEDNDDYIDIMDWA